MPDQAWPGQCRDWLRARSGRPEYRRDSCAQHQRRPRPPPYGIQTPPPTPPTNPPPPPRPRCLARVTLAVQRKQHTTHGLSHGNLGFDARHGVRVHLARATNPSKLAQHSELLLPASNNPGAGLLQPEVSLAGQFTPQLTRALRKLIGATGLGCKTQMPKITHRGTDHLRGSLAHEHSQSTSVCRVGNPKAHNAGTDYEHVVPRRSSLPCGIQ